MSENSERQSEYRFVEDEDMRQFVWNDFLQKGIVGLPTDYSLRDFLYSAVNLLSNELSKERASRKEIARRLDSANVQLGQNEVDYARQIEIRRQICDNVHNLCHAIIENAGSTHGQKNGMVLLIATLVNKWKYIGDHPGDIPF